MNTVKEKDQVCCASDSTLCLPTPHTHTQGTRELSHLHQDAVSLFRKESRRKRASDFKKLALNPQLSLEQSECRVALWGHESSSVVAAYSGAPTRDLHLTEERGWSFHLEEGALHLSLTPK